MFVHIISAFLKSAERGKYRNACCSAVSTTTWSVRTRYLLLAKPPKLPVLAWLSRMLTEPRGFPAGLLNTQRQHCTTRKQTGPLPFERRFESLNNLHCFAVNLCNLARLPQLSILPYTSLESGRALLAENPS
jgi:hypothetical protein